MTLFLYVLYVLSSVISLPHHEMLNLPPHLINNSHLVVQERLDSHTFTLQLHLLNARTPLSPSPPPPRSNPSPAPQTSNPPPTPRPPAPRGPPQGTAALPRSAGTPGARTTRSARAATKSPSSRAAQHPTPAGSAPRRAP